ncbi:hypothetical protein AB5I41_21940 [Sphingomonas sp. MMS24-JH45]
MTDHASFAWIDDVWVDEPARGRGDRATLIRHVFDHPDFATVRRYALVTADAHAVYETIGFHAPLHAPARWMKADARVRGTGWRT